MTQSNTDPRVLRTRKLIMDSFTNLSDKKEFTDITVKDITTEAMINRATFYYHFEDKYDLLDKALPEVLMVNLSSNMYEESEFNEETIISIFLATTRFQESLSNRCKSGYEEKIARFVREQLEIILYKMLLKQRKNKDKQTLKVIAVILSWGIYGASEDWKRNNEKLSPEEFIKLAIPYIMSGIDVYSKST
ncbi:TetR/AcrR family transcriptional regulator [Gracilibacillus alcaliphilus]|uniref:TetR/AcrR family transcriptional regulator n=1 Tax=Gracilibacillus alcaliphilus TaxID=1401441 RepID=UPI0019582798|nr:TetR/AcrR family transcriptional regulator [Gracilibacillus alcaliphilus]MBM7678048.1 AcrR family transcriptional regulator [Gracilibacillus alcaliphilus]